MLLYKFAIERLTYRVFTKPHKKRPSNFLKDLNLLTNKTNSLYVKVTYLHNSNGVKGISFLLLSRYPACRCCDPLNSIYSILILCFPLANMV